MGTFLETFLAPTFGLFRPAFWTRFVSNVVSETVCLQFCLRSSCCVSRRVSCSRRVAVCVRLRLSASARLVCLCLRLSVGSCALVCVCPRSTGRAQRARRAQRAARAKRYRRSEGATVTQPKRNGNAWDTPLRCVLAALCLRLFASACLLAYVFLCLRAFRGSRKLWESLAHALGKTQRLKRASRSLSTQVLKFSVFPEHLSKVRPLKGANV